MRLAVVSLPFPNEKTWQAQFALQLVSALAQVGHEVSVLTSALITTVASVDVPRIQVHKVFQKKMLSDSQRLIETLMRVRPEKLLLVIDKKIDLKWSGIFLTLFATAQAMGCAVYVIVHSGVIQSSLDELRLAPLLVQAKKVFSAYPSKNYPWFEMNTSLVGLQSVMKTATSSGELSGNVFVFGELKKRPGDLRSMIKRIAEIQPGEIKSPEKIHLALSHQAESLFKHLVIEELRHADLLSKVEFVPDLDFETCERILADCSRLVLLDDFSPAGQIPWIVGMALSRNIVVEPRVPHSKVGQTTVDEMTNSILREIVASG